jgi:hypothetical protein
MKNSTQSMGAGALLALALSSGMAPSMAHAQQVPMQVPIPTTAAQVPGPTPGTAMTREYVQTVGRTAYFWGYALVATSNRRAEFASYPSASFWAASCPCLRLA